MDARIELLKHAKEHHLAQGNFLGLIHLLVGRRIVRADGTLVCAGLTWRELAALLKKVRWDKLDVRELGLDPQELPLRDRERFWYHAIAQTPLDTVEAIRAGDTLAQVLQQAGFLVGPPPNPKA